MTKVDDILAAALGKPKPTEPTTEIPPNLHIEDTRKSNPLDTDFKASGLRLLELKAGRHNDDIPLTDEYWVALKKHNKAFGVNS